RRDAVVQQVRDPPGEDAGLARACAREDQERAALVGDRRVLLGVEPRQVPGFGAQGAPYFGRLITRPDSLEPPSGRSGGASVSRTASKGRARGSSPAPSRSAADPSSGGAGGASVGSLPWPPQATDRARPKEPTRAPARTIAS